jgi:hypothetical protein
MTTRKDRRHNGYVTPRLTVSPEELIRNNLFVNTFYDDWEDYRDSFRDWFRDFKTIKEIRAKRGKYFCEELLEKRIRMNLKQKKLLKRRKFRKSHTYY